MEVPCGFDPQDFLHRAPYTKPCSPWSAGNVSI